MWKRLSTLIAILCFNFVLTNNAFAAIGATAVWEVRTAGSATNGGFYTSGGTDWSQQDGVKYALTGCTTAAANAIILNADASADMVGNGLYVVSGTNFKVGWYEIKSVVAGVSITVDQNCTTDVGALGVVNIGGAVDKPSTISASVVAGNTIYIKAGTYQNTGGTQVLSITVSGNDTTPIKWVGYNATRTDQPQGTDRPYLDANNNETYAIYIGVYRVNYFYHLRCGRATAAGIQSANDSNLRCVFFNCKSSSNGGDGASVTAARYIDCEVNDNVGDGFDRGGGSESEIQFLNCYSHDNTGLGCNYTDKGHTQFLGCVFESNSASGISRSGEFCAINSIFYNNTGSTSDGINWSYNDAEYNLGCIINCIFMNNGRYGVNFTVGAEAMLADYNCYYGNSTAATLNLAVGLNDVIADPLLNDPANGDFTLQSGSPAIGVGFPNTWLLHPGAGNSFPGTVATSNATSPYDDVDWTNPNNIKASDNTYATATINNNYTYTAVSTNFGFAVPSDATIKGVVVKIEAKAATAARVQLPYVKLIKTGAAAGDNKGTTTKLTTSDVVYIFGNDSDLWGNTLTPSDVNASNFGVEFAAQETTSNATATSIDGIKITVFYALSRNYKTNIGVDQDDNTAAGGTAVGSLSVSTNF